jgi:predicted LPLAT superfamily acyltransferase
MAGLYRGGNRYHLVFEPVADFTDVTRASRDAEVNKAVERYAQLLEKHCRSDPYDWFNFFDFWKEAPTHA